MIRQCSLPDAAAGKPCEGKRHVANGTVNADARTKVILEFQAAVLPADTEALVRLQPVSFRLLGGDWMLVQVAADRARLPLAAAATGLMPAESGWVQFLDHRWNQREHRREATLRSRIGQVFEGRGWISNLTVLENVLLASRHHTRTADTELQQAADRWARRFGLSQVPRSRPSLVEEETLRRSEWVRAFLATPDLLIFERPERGVNDEHLGALLDAADEARGRGAAVLWISSDPRVEIHPRSRGARQFAVRGTELVPRGSAA